MASQYYNTDLNSSRVNVRMPEYDTSGLLKAGQSIGDSMKFWKDRDLEAYKFKKDQELLERDRARFGREQELNKRVDTEYNREIGLRDMRKDLAAQYEANPYADIWGGGAATKGLDKQVIDYVNAGGEITPDMAGRLQSEYEKNRPFKEDLSQVFRSKLLAAGEDPTKADAYAKSMTDNMPFSRATQQAQLDKQQEVTQKWYDAQADANLEALKLNMDANKVNANNATDILKSRISSGFGGASGGGGSKGTAPGGYANLTADELSLSWMPAFTKMGDEASTQDIINGLQAKSVPSGIAQKALEESVVTKGADRYVDKNLLKANVDRYMGVYGQTAAGGASATTVDAEVNPKQLLAQFAPRQIAGYDPQGVLERAKTAVPELFSGASGGVTADKMVDYTRENPNVPLTGGKVINHVPGVPDSLVKSEGFIVGKDGMFRSYTDSNAKGENKGMAIAGGYNYTSKSPAEIKSDFEKAGIPSAQAELAIAGQPIKFSEQQGKALFANEYKKTGNDKAAKLVPGYNELNPMMKEVASSMAYRGDLVPGEKGYRGDLVNVLKTGDIGKVYDYVNNMPVPMEVKSRLGDILTVERSREEMGMDTPITNNEVRENSTIKELFSNSETNKVSSADIRSQIDTLNKQGINSDDDIKAFKDLELKYKLAKEQEIKNTTKPYSKNLFEMMGLVEPRGTKVLPVDEKQKLLENPNASIQEPGLEDRTLDFVPLGAFAKTKALKTTDYDNAVMDLFRGNSKSGGLSIDGKLLDELYGSSPLATVKDISEFSKGISKMTPAVREELVRYASQLRDIKNPTLQQEEMLSRINNTLRKTK